MFGLQELKQTMYFQEIRAEAKKEAKLECVPRLLALGLTVEQIAQALELDVAEVHQIEGKIEGKLECVPRLLALGLTVEQISQAFELDVETVRKAIVEE